MSTTPEPLTARLTPEQSERLAREAGLGQLGGVPPLRTYLRDIWANRHLIWALSSSQARTQNQNNYLGRLWSLLNPLLLVASYYFIFIVLLDTNSSNNKLGFLMVGIFVFGYTSSCLTAGAKAVTGNITLVRALRFPRALLPISVTLTQFLSNIPSFLLLLVLMPLTGEPITTSWLLFPVALAIQTLLNLGLAFYCARLVSVSRDVGNLIPVVVRLGRYISGVFFSVTEAAAKLTIKYHAAAAGAILLYQPLAVPLSTVRESIMSEFEFDLTTWIVALAWAVGLSVTGLLFFWRGEGRYGGK